MSSSDDSDNENLQKLLESADPIFLPNSLFKNPLNSTDLSPTKRNIENTVEKDIPKSQRYLPNDETFDTDLNIPQSMQDHIAKRLSAIIANKVEFAEEPNKTPEQNLKNEKKREKLWKSRVKLLQDSDAPIKPFETHTWEVKVPDRKPEIKRRLIEPDGLDAVHKVELAAVDPSVILSGEEIKHWAKRRERKEKIFKYKQAKSGGTLHFIEPENEFTKLRKKNCWSEKKIATWKPK